MNISKGVIRINTTDFNIMSTFNEGESSEFLKSLIDLGTKLPPIKSVKWYFLYKKHYTVKAFWREYRKITAMADKTSSFYHSFSIKKKNGNLRSINRVDYELECEQRWILENILKNLPVSKYAKAYIKGLSIKDNASPHMGNKELVNIDIKHFFDSISSKKIYKMFERETGYSNDVMTFLTKLCSLNGKLPQGACTSPAIANLVMKQFDEAVGNCCEINGITYTRYSDDMTFSGDSIDANELIDFIKKILKNYGFSINEKKLKIVNKGSSHKVTGIVCNEKLSVDKKYKKQIRQEVYYIKKYGVAEHLLVMNDERFLKNNKPKTITYLNNLLGRINFVLNIEKDNSEFIEYKKLVREMQIDRPAARRKKIRSNYHVQEYLGERIYANKESDA